VYRVRIQLDYENEQSAIEGNVRELRTECIADTLRLLSGLMASAYGCNSTIVDEIREAARDL